MSAKEQTNLDRACKDIVRLRRQLAIARSYLVTYASSTAGENLAKKALREMEEVE